MCVTIFFVFTVCAHDTSTTQACDNLLLDQSSHAQATTFGPASHEPCARAANAGIQTVLGWCPECTSILAANGEDLKDEMIIRQYWAIKAFMLVGVPMSAHRVDRELLFRASPVKRREIPEGTLSFEEKALGRSLRTLSVRAGASRIDEDVIVAYVAGALGDTLRWVRDLRGSHHWENPSSDGGSKTTLPRGGTPGRKITAGGGEERDAEKTSVTSAGRIQNQEPSLGLHPLDENIRDSMAVARLNEPLTRRTLADQKGEMEHRDAQTLAIARHGLDERRRAMIKRDAAITLAQRRALRGRMRAMQHGQGGLRYSYAPVLWKEHGDKIYALAALHAEQKQLALQEHGAEDGQVAGMGDGQQVMVRQPAEISSKHPDDVFC